MYGLWIKINSPSFELFINNISQGASFRISKQSLTFDMWPRQPVDEIRISVGNRNDNTQQTQLWLQII